MPNPIFESDDGDASAANRAAVDKVKQRAQELESDQELEAGGSMDEESPVIDLNAEEPAREEPSRDEKKRNRFRDAQERAEAAERELVHYRQLTQTLQQHAPPPQQPQEDPRVGEVDQRLADARRRRKIMFQEFNARASTQDPSRRLNQPDIDDYERKSNEIEDEIGGLVFQRNHIRNAPDPRREFERSQQVALYTTYQDVYDHRDHQGQNPALDYANGYALQHKHSWKGNPQELVDKAMQEARRIILKRGRPAPDVRARAALSGEGAGATTTGENRTNSEQSITMNKTFRKLANAAFPHIKDSTERFTKWAKGPGKRHITEMHRRGRMMG
jgi:hypothetical protein